MPVGHVCLHAALLDSLKRPNVRPADCSCFCPSFIMCIPTSHFAFNGWRLDLSFISIQT